MSLFIRLRAELDLPRHRGLSLLAFALSPSALESCKPRSGMRRATNERKASQRIGLTAPSAPTACKLGGRDLWSFADLLDSRSHSQRSEVHACQLFYHPRVASPAPAALEVHLRSAQRREASPRLFSQGERLQRLHASTGRSRGPKGLIFISKGSCDKRFNSPARDASQPRCPPPLLQLVLPPALVVQHLGKRLTACHKASEPAAGSSPKFHVAACAFLSIHFNSLQCISIFLGNFTSRRDLRRFVPSLLAAFHTRLRPLSSSCRAPTLCGRNEPTKKWEASTGSEIPAELEMD